LDLANNLGWCPTTHESQQYSEPIVYSIFITWSFLFQVHSQILLRPNLFGVIALFVLPVYVVT